MCWYVYLVECLDGSLYTGITTDVERRMEEHREGEGSKYVRSRGFKELVSFLQVGSRSEASKVEYRVKQMSPEEKVDFFKA